MPEKIEYREIGWAELKPDVYAGDNCDDVHHQWSCYMEGDKDGEDGLTKLDLFATVFPPGTKITISEPCCPECGEQSSMHFNPKHEGFADKEHKCQCGFDWHDWMQGQYS